MNLLLTQLVDFDFLRSYQGRHWLAAESAPHVPGSQHRILWEEEGVWYWEEEPIDFGKLIR